MINRTQTSRRRAGHVAGVCCCCALLLSLPAAARAQTAPTGPLTTGQTPAPAASPDPGATPRESLLASVYPIFDGLDRGAGFTAGVGLKRPMGGTRFLDLRSAVSWRGYLGSSIRFVMPDLADGRAELAIGARYRESPQMSFFGLGRDGDVSDRTSFELRRVRVGADLTFRPGRALFVEATSAAVMIGSEDGDGPYPSTETRFTSADAPGLMSSPTFVHNAVGVGLDQRAEGPSLRGRFLRASVGRWQALGGRALSFNQADVEGLQHVRIARDDSVLTLRASATFTSTAEGHQVPHYLLPSLGGRSTLRGYANFRFQDRQRAFVSAEYRVKPVAPVEMSVFFDAGQVAAQVRQLGLGDFRTSVGIGTRIRGPRSSSIGFSVARSTEGYRYYFSFSPKF